MCSIGAVLCRDNKNLEKKKQLIKNLLIQMQERGREATGIAMINTEEDKIEVLKGAVDSQTFIENDKFNLQLDKNIETCNLFLLHTRQPTKGDKSNNLNNHPLYSKEFNSVLVHNGIINNDEEMKKKHNLVCDGQVDSEVILAMSNKYEDMNKIYTELSGSFAFALYHKKVLTLLRYSNPIVMAYIKELDLIVFASTREMIERAISEREEYLGGLFSERKFIYSAVFKEVKNNTFIKFTFNQKEFEWKEENLYVIKSKKKKGLDNFIHIKKSQRPKSYMEALIEDGEEYEGEFDKDDDDIWFMDEYCPDCNLKNYECVCNEVNKYCNKQSWSEKADGKGLWCDNCQMSANHCKCQGSRYWN